MSKLSFELWLEVNEQNHNCYLAESERDRELDFDPEIWLEEEYDNYLKQENQS